MKRQVMEIRRVVSDCELMTYVPGDLIPNIFRKMVREFPPNQYIYAQVENSLTDRTTILTAYARPYRASDIPDEWILRLVRTCPFPGAGESRFAIERALPQFPTSVVFAKIRQMINKGRLLGCSCGCRGGLKEPPAPIEVIKGGLCGSKLPEKD